MRLEVKIWIPACGIVESLGGRAHWWSRCRERMVKLGLLKNLEVGRGERPG